MSLEWPGKPNTDFALPLTPSESVLLLSQEQEGQDVKSYVFPVVVKPDEDVWRAYVPDLEARGAATWGHTREEALRNIQEVTQMVIEELLEDGEALPACVTVSDQPVVAVTV
jgi:predicted RNase H-like HicB family nuclease